ncbi:MAG: DUF4105 domain-containing protein, partial [Myxococcaceae bacterium]
MKRVVTHSSKRPTVQARLISLCLSLVLFPCAAHAASAPDPASSIDFRKFREDTGVSVSCAMEPCPPWTASALEDFKEAFNRLPPKLRAPPGGLKILVHRNERELGLGDGTRHAPEWTSDTFHVYGFSPSTERRASWRLESLSEDARVHLWRQRAFVHAVMKRWDDAKHFSERPLWRRLSGWSWGVQGDRPANIFPGAYSRARGMASAQLDLLTFAEEFFAPVPDDALAIDEQVRCQELSKSRALHTLLYEAKLVDAPYERAACPAFDGWAAIDRLDSIEVLLVASSGKRPESLFGHLLMRPVHREGATVQGQSFESAIQIAAITDGEAAGPIYVYRGIFGGYRTAIFTLSLRDLEREVLDGEQRTIRRFKLQLSPLEQERLMERVFELERRGYYDYRFFTSNCATQIAELVQSAVDEDTTITMPGVLLASPGTALDAFASVQREGHDGKRALITRVNGDLEPSSVIADRAEAERFELEQQLRTDSHVETLFEQAHSAKLSERLGALRELAALPVDQKSVLYRWWLDTVRVERFRVDRARTALRKLELATLLPNGSPESTDSVVAERQALFERESRLDENLMELDRADAAREWWSKAPRRPFTEAEQLQKAELEAQVSAFDDVTRLQGEVIDRSLSDVSPKTVLREESARLETSQQSWAERATLHSGTWRNAFGVTFAGDVPLVRLQSAGMRELLGDQRVRGLAAGTELHVLDADATFAPTLGWPELRESHFTLFGWRSLGRKQPSLRDGLYEWFGYGFQASTDYWNQRALPNRTRIDVESFALLDADATFERHLAIGLGARGELDWADLSRGA